MLPKIFYLHVKRMLIHKTPVMDHEGVLNDPMIHDHGQLDPDRLNCETAEVFLF